MNAITPLEITIDRQKGQISIEWSDGHKSVYPASLLRKACPCAECRGDETGTDSEPELNELTLPLVDQRTTRIRQAGMVGNYALNIEWEDGHHFGIYHWAYLRSLCPCPPARRTR